MNYTIKNEFLKVEISDKGGELQSIKSKKDGTEYLWQGNPKYWAGRAYNLFPICGRLYDGKYTYKGKTYEMNLHGFARASVMETEMLGDTSVRFTLRSNAETRAQYPFEFVFTLTYTLTGNRIRTLFGVRNTGDEEMIFCVGGHPGFNVPLIEGEAFEDYYLEFDTVEPMKRLEFTPFFFTGRSEPYPLREGKYLDLSHDLFSVDARFFTDMSKGVTLKSRKSDKAVRLEYEGMCNLGIWHKPQTTAPYVCIEPWCSVPSMDGKVEDLEEKYEMTRLASGAVYENYFDILTF